MTDIGNIVRLHPAMTLCKPFELRDEKEIPPREWLYAPWCIRGFVSLLHGNGGVGKTSLYIGEALAIVTGRNLLGVQPAKRASVWILCLEDPRDELERRVAATARRHGIKNVELANRLFVDGAPATPFIVARHGYEGFVVDGELVEAVVERVQRNMIDLVIVDPLASSHAIPESDNSEMNALVAVWRGIASRTNCAILLVHHGRKGQIDANAPAESARGGSALIDAARTARLLRAMTPDEATNPGVTEGERRQLARVLDSKNNLTALGAGSWIKITQMHLDNGNGVGAVEQWQAPDALDAIGPEELDRVVDELARRGPQRESKQSPQWLGWLAADLLALPGAVERSVAAKSSAGAIVDTLAKTGRIRRVTETVGRKERLMWEAVALPGGPGK